MLYVLNSADYSLKKQVSICHNREHDGLYIGLEDMKLMYNENQLHYICNRGINAGKIQVEYGQINDNGSCESRLLTMEGQKMIEKNWVLFRHLSEDTQYFIYNWHPLQIGKIIDDPESNDERTHNTIIDNKYTTPVLFRHVRGSTNGVIIGDEVWFLCHLVNYENKRFYYHMFVVLNPSEQYQLKKYSQLFTFDKCPVEYTTGFVYNEQKKKFMIGYSTNDNTTNFINLDKQYVDNLFI